MRQRALQAPMLQGPLFITLWAGTVLNAGANENLGVTFTPTDATDYTSANGSYPDHRDRSHGQHYRQWYAYSKWRVRRRDQRDGFWLRCRAPRCLTKPTPSPTTAPPRDCRYPPCLLVTPWFPLGKHHQYRLNHNIHC